MIRKIAILALTALSVLIVIAWSAGYPSTPGTRSHDYGSGLTLIRSGAGRVVLMDLPNGRQLGLSSLSGDLGVLYFTPLAKGAAVNDRAFDFWLAFIDCKVLKPFPVPARYNLSQEEQQSFAASIDRTSHVRYRMQIQAWALLALTAAYPLIVLVRFVRRNRRSQNNCKKCGYDLTGNVTGRCSECGEEVKKS